MLKKLKVLSTLTVQGVHQQAIGEEERRVYEVVVVMKQLFQHLEESLAPIDHTHGRWLVLSRSARF